MTDKKDSDAKAKEADLVPAPPVNPNDEHHGKGGVYVIDEKGNRKKAE